VCLNTLLATNFNITLFLKIAEGLTLPEWIKPYHIEKIKSIIMTKKSSEMIYENLRLQKIIIGEQIC